MAELTKAEPDGRHPKGHYLVVENPDQVTTWHLRYKDAQGNIDHRLMGACWAALHGGYRGNKYEGPQKDQALKKLIALYKSEGMPLPSASMSDGDDAVTGSVGVAGPVGHAGHPGPRGAPLPSDSAFFAAEFTDSANDGDMVIKRGKLFECGVYADKAFELTPEEMQEAAAAFTPAPVDIGDAHIPTVLEGKMGHVSRIYLGDDGKSVMGEVHLPRWLDTALGDGARKVSTEWNRATKRLERLCLVKNPRVTDAALMSAYADSATPDELAAAFAAARHDTASGQAVMQTMHDMSIQNGASCRKVAAMASRHEAAAMQSIHDVTIQHGAACESATPPVPQPQAPGAPAAAYHYSQFSQTRPKRRTRMNAIDWILGKAKEENVDLDEEEVRAAFSSQPAEDVKQVKAELDAKQREIDALKAQQEQASATFARMEQEKRHSQAVAFAQNAVSAKRVTPGSADALAAVYERVSAADTTATFADGEKSTTAILEEFVQSLPDLSVFTTDAVKSSTAVAALFNPATTAGVNGHDKAKVEDDKKAILGGTQLGQTVLKDLKAQN